MARLDTTDPAEQPWAHLDRTEWPPKRTSVRTILAKNVDDLPILFWIEMSLSPVLRTAYCGAVTEMCGTICRLDRAEKAEMKLLLDEVLAEVLADLLPKAAPSPGPDIGWRAD
jgi:hypothetical protein